jgi:hypothetical protein
MHLLYLVQSYSPYAKPHDDHRGEGLLSLHSTNQDFHKLWLLGHLHDDVGVTCGSRYYLALQSLDHPDCRVRQSVHQWHERDTSKKGTHKLVFPHRE